MDETMLMEFKRLAAKVYDQSGIRLNADKAVKVQNLERLRVWEKTLQVKGDSSFNRTRSV
jgi:hypothetical protein